MDKELVRVTLGTKEIIFVGTNHVKAESAELVRSVIREEKPDTICIEWDEKRYKKNMNPDEWEDTDLIEIIKSKQFPIFMFNFLYKHFQKSMIKDNSTVVGGEFVGASEEALALGSELVLIDRDSHITFKRAWKGLSLFQRLKFPLAFTSILEESGESEEDIEKLLESENFEPVFIALKDKFPKFWVAFVEERDDYMATKILDSLGEKTVVVMGKGHLEGVVERIEARKKVELEPLETLPVPTMAGKLSKWIIPLVIFSLLAYSFTQSPSVGFEQIKTWIFWKGTTASIFTLLALAHPLAIVVAFLFAPFTTFIPFVSVGIFTALIEAKFRKPRVKDFERMDVDIKSIKSIYKNRVLRIFLVFTLSNIGSVLGNFLGGLDIIKNLF